MPFIPPLPSEDLPREYFDAVYADDRERLERLARRYQELAIIAGVFLWALIIIGAAVCIAWVKDGRRGDSPKSHGRIAAASLIAGD